MGVYQDGDVLAYHEPDGRIRTHDGGPLPDYVKEKDIITRQMIDNSDTLYFDDFTGEQITA